MEAMVTLQSWILKTMTWGHTQRNLMPPLKWLSVMQQESYIQHYQARYAAQPAPCDVLITHVKQVLPRPHPKTSFKRELLLHLYSILTVSKGKNTRQQAFIQLADTFLAEYQLLSKRSCSRRSFFEWLKRADKAWRNQSSLSRTRADMRSLISRGSVRQQLIDFVTTSPQAIRRESGPLRFNIAEFQAHVNTRFKAEMKHDITLATASAWLRKLGFSGTTMTAATSVCPATTAESEGSGQNVKPTETTEVKADA
jgi:hypothetical protein